MYQQAKPTGNGKLRFWIDDGRIRKANRLATVQRSKPSERIVREPITTHDVHAEQLQPAGR